MKIILFTIIIYLYYIVTITVIKHMIKEDFNIYVTRKMYEKYDFFSKKQ